eukprot:scaffold351_cov371-Prasinococcus_capsulatus_cf.AAC.14
MSVATLRWARNRRSRVRRLDRRETRRNLSVPWRCRKVGLLPAMRRACFEPARPARDPASTSEPDSRRARGVTGWETDRSHRRVREYVAGYKWESNCIPPPQRICLLKCANCYSGSVLCSHGAQTGASSLLRNPRKRPWRAPARGHLPACLQAGTRFGTGSCAVSWTCDRQLSW